MAAALRSEERVGVRGHSCLIASKEPSPLRRQGSSDFGFGLQLLRLRDLAAYAAGVPTSCRRPGYFLLLAQEKVTKEKGTPIAALAGEAGQCVRVGRAFRRGSCPGEKCQGSLPGTPAGPVVRPSPPLKGVRRSKAQSPEPKARAASLHIALMNQRSVRTGGPFPVGAHPVRDSLTERNRHGSAVAHRVRSYKVCKGFSDAGSKPSWPRRVAG